MSDKPKKPRRVLHAVEPWASRKTTDPAVKDAILKVRLRHLAQLGFSIDDIWRVWKQL
jgi:hypothetical protein